MDVTTMEDLIAIFTSWSVQTVAALVFLYVLLKLFKRVRHTPGRRPPGPPALPLIGHFHHLMVRLPHQSLAKISEKYGPIVWLELGAVSVVVVSSSDMAREILKTQDHIFASRPAVILGDMLFAKGQDLLFCPLNDHFRRVRKMYTTELLSPKRIESFQNYRRDILSDRRGLFLVQGHLTVDSSYYKSLKKMLYEVLISVLVNENEILIPTFLQDLRRELVLNMMRTAFEEGQANRFLNLPDILHEQFMSMMTRMLFRMDARAQNKEFIRIIYEITSTGWFVIEEYFPLLKPLDLGGQVKRLKKLGKKYFDLMDSIIDTRLKENSNSKSNSEEDFMDVLLAMTGVDESKETSNLTRLHVKVLLLDLILAGSETSADTIVWAITELLRHPNIMERVQNELDDVIGKERLVEEADLKKLEYLQAVVKETLRLHPVGVLGAPHLSIEATKVAGYDIPANTRVMVNIYAIGRDPKVWENPLKFDPSRFINNPVDVRGQHYEVLPFGAGRRKCVGMNLALLSVAYNLAHLIHACTISLPEGLTHLDIDVEERFGTSVTRQNPLNVLIKRRLPSDVYQ